MRQHLTYFKSLDALRFLSFLAMFTFHFQLNDSDNGFVYEVLISIKKSLFIGVDFFFVLSSFLLTHLAMQEYKSTNSFSFKKFMVRRILRIWPLYFLMVIIGFVVLPIIASIYHLHVSLPPVGYYLLFASNFFTVPHVFFLMFLWSIAVEEQLYLLFAFLFKYLMAHLKKICIAFIFVYIVFIVAAGYFKWSVYTNTLNYLPDFSVGVMLAFAFTAQKKWIDKLSDLHTVAKFSFYMITFSLIVLSINYAEGIRSQLLSKLLMCALFSFAILDQVAFKNSTFKLERFHSITWLGKRTYGLYCYHGIAFTLYTLIPQNFKSGFINQVAAYILLLLITILLASISYNVFELRFLKLKKKFY